MQNPIKNTNAYKLYKAHEVDDAWADLIDEFGDLDEGAVLVYWMMCLADIAPNVTDAQLSADNAKAALKIFDHGARG